MYRIQNSILPFLVVHGPELIVLHIPTHIEFVTCWTIILKNTNYKS